MAHAIVSYGTALTDAVGACPGNYSLAEVFRATVMRVAEHSSAQPRTRKIMEIAAKYPRAREAQLSRLAEVQEHLAEAFARRSRKGSGTDLKAHLFAGLTLSILGVTFRTWFDSSSQDISATVDKVLATLGQFTGEKQGVAGRKADRQKLTG
jgi:hypothetical protein